MLISRLFSKKALNNTVKCFSNSTLPQISEILKIQTAGTEVKVQGWVKSVRNQKENVFIDINDGSTDKNLQIFIPKSLKPANLATWGSITASGALKLSPKGDLELLASEIAVCGQCVISEGFPFAPRKSYAPEYIRQYLHFRPRTSKFSALLRVRSKATMAIHNYFKEEGFVNIHTPVLTSNDCEGAGETFKVLPESRNLIKSMIREKQEEDEAYFNTKTFLTVSGQLHLEAAVHGLGRVYTFGPTFRAENSKSRLHLSEFYMLEAEIAFINELQDIINFIEKLIKRVTGILLDDAIEDMHRCQDLTTIFTWVDKKFPVLTYKEAVAILNSNQDKFDEKFDPKGGLSKEHELFLVKYCDNVPVFVINWPREMKSFYMKECGEGEVAALDLLAPNVGEIVGGSLREENYEKLKEKVGTSSQLDWYLELRKFGAVPSGGFGLGFERYLQLILGISNIKDTIPFPRWPHNCSL